MKTVLLDTNIVLDALLELLQRIDAITPPWRLTTDH
jgi:hypothetical protein